MTIKERTMGGVGRKLRVDEVNEIKRLFVSGQTSQPELAEEYQVSQATISRAIHRSHMWVQESGSWHQVPLETIQRRLVTSDAVDAMPAAVPASKQDVLKRMLALFDELQRHDPLEVAKQVNTKKGARDIHRDFWPALAWLGVFFEELRAVKKDRQLALSEEEE